MDNNLKILLADAGEDFRRLLRDVLENEADFEVVGATGSGTEAAEMAARLLPDVVLTDMVLSDVDGLGLIEALNAMPEGERPVICHRRQSGRGGHGRGSGLLHEQAL